MRFTRLEREDLVVGGAKKYIFQIFFVERKNVKFGEKISFVFLFFVLCVSIKTLSSLFFSLFLLFVGGVFVSRVIIKKYSQSSSPRRWFRRPML